MINKPTREQLRRFIDDQRLIRQIEDLFDAVVELQEIAFKPYWVDVDFPIIIRTTGPNIPTLVALQGNITAPQWQVNDYNVCEGQELVHLWQEGTDGYWHCHLVTNGTDVTDRYVNFEVEYCYADVNGVLSASSTVTSGDVLIPANTPSKTHLVISIAQVNLPLKIAAHVWPRLRRIASTGTAPTNNPWCTMLQMHIQCDTVGSHEIMTK